MSEMGDMWRDLREHRKWVRATYGVPCPECTRLLPRTNPSILLPGQQCKVDQYRDPRNRLTDEEYNGESSDTGN